MVTSSVLKPEKVFTRWRKGGVRQTKHVETRRAAKENVLSAEIRISTFGTVGSNQSTGMDGIILGELFLLEEKAVYTSP